MQNKKRQKLWRIVAIMLAVFLAFGVMNVPKYAGSNVSAATSDDYYVSFDSGDDYFNIPDCTTSKELMSVTVTPALPDGYTLKFSTNSGYSEKTTTYGMDWEIKKASGSANDTSTKFQIFGVANGKSTTGSTSLYVVLLDKDGFSVRQTSKYISITNYKYTITYNGKGGLTEVSNQETGEYEQVSTYSDKVEEGSRLGNTNYYSSYSYGWRSFSWPETTDYDYEDPDSYYTSRKMFLGYRIQGDSSLKIYTKNETTVNHYPDRYAYAGDYLVFSNLTLDAIWSDYAMVYFYSDKKAYDNWKDKKWGEYQGEESTKLFNKYSLPEGYFSKYNTQEDDYHYQTVTYDAVAKGEKLIVSGSYFDTPVTDNNKVFIGWRCMEDGKLYTSSNISEFVPTKAKTAFVAEYGDGYTVKFVAGKEGYFAGDYDYEKDEYKQLKEKPFYYKPNTYIYSAPYAVSLDNYWNRESNVITNKGYEDYSIVGWNDGSKTYTLEELYGYKVTANATFTAVWKKNIASTIVLHSNYPANWGKREDTSVSKTTESSGSISLGRPFSNPGSYTIASYHASDGASYEAGSNFYPTSAKVDLYADWAETEYYKINMHSNYPSSWGKAQTTLELGGEKAYYFYPSMEGETIRAQGKEDFYISYWFYYDENGEKVEVSNRFKPTSNMELYANWTTDLPHEHTWDQGTVIKEPTYDEEGRRVYKCTHCSEEHVEGIAKLEKPVEQTYSSEWVNGKWYEADGSQTYAGIGSWKSDANGYWFEDTSGWYPVSTWQKIDGKWYYFTSSGYMDYSEYRDGCWLGADGAWVETYYGGKWCSDATGWWYTDAAGWYPVDQWVWIDGSQYHFNGSGYWDQ